MIWPGRSASPGTRNRNEIYKYKIHYSDYLWNEWDWSRPMSSFVVSGEPYNLPILRAGYARTPPYVTWMVHVYATILRFLAFIQQFIHSRNLVMLKYGLPFGVQFSKWTEWNMQPSVPANTIHSGRNAHIIHRAYQLNERTIDFCLALT